MCCLPAHSHALDGRLFKYVVPLILCLVTEAHSRPTFPIPRPAARLCITPGSHVCCDRIAPTHSCTARADRSVSFDWVCKNRAHPITEPNVRRKKKYARFLPSIGWWVCYFGEAKLILFLPERCVSAVCHSQHHLALRFIVDVRHAKPLPCLPLFASQFAH